MRKAALLFIFIALSLSAFSQSTGCVYGDCDNGYGKYVWESGDEYIGNWLNNRQHGEGSYYYKSGDKYVGEYKNGKREGTGTFTWNDKTMHTGQWKEDKQHGEGTYYDENGSVKVGIWKSGTYQGKVSEITGCVSGDCDNGIGTYVWANGMKYTGAWVKMRRKGQGINYYTDGSSYDGEWLNDKRHGYGTMYNNDDTEQAGLWEDDKYTGTGSNNYGCISGDCSSGYGIYTWETGDKYEGNWLENRRNGEGTNYYKSGAIGKGNWKSDYLHEYGTYIYEPSSDYKSYTGGYDMGNLTGSGTLEFKNGQKYVGEFDNNYYQGEGTMYYADGTVESGTWDKSVFIKKKEIKTGCITGDCNTGFGTYTYKNGDKYVGSFLNSTFSGRGIFTYVMGAEYDGEFAYGKFNGEGTYTYKSGKKYVGEFKNGKPNGIGTLYLTDGTTQSGLWENNVFKGNNENKSKPTVSWLTPEYYTTNAQDKKVKAKICIKSESDLQNVQFLVNGQIKVNYATRGYSVVDAGCDYTIEKELPLEPGDNKLLVKVTNSGGEVTSEERIVNFESESGNINQKRIALVIGNAKYNVSPLKNPVNDAIAISKELKALGFEVLSFTDLSRNDMIRKINEFGEKLKTNQGVGLFYYAGHGLELKGENYIIPVNANIQKEQDVELECVNLKRVLGEMDYAQNDLNIIILDACRDNPFARSFRSGGQKGYGTTDAPKGTFIAFGTAPGDVASDGKGKNGLYTQELIKAIKTPGLKLEDVFKQVRREVYKISGEKQLTWQNSAVFGDFYFKK